jgi:hypothetical protein
MLNDDRGTSDGLAHVLVRFVHRKYPNSPVPNSKYCAAVSIRFKQHFNSRTLPESAAVNSDLPRKMSFTRISWNLPDLKHSGCGNTPASVCNAGLNIVTIVSAGTRVPSGRVNCLVARRPEETDYFRHKLREVHGCCKPLTSCDAIQTTSFLQQTVKVPAAFEGFPVPIAPTRVPSVLYFSSDIMQLICWHYCNLKKHLYEED